MSRDPTEKISADRIGEKGAISEEKSVVPDQSEFQSYMQRPLESEQGAPPEGISPMELPKGLNLQTAGPTIENLLGQVNSAEGSLSDIRSKLDTPNLKFKRQHQYLLRNKLGDANNHLRSAGNRLGADMPDPTKVAADANPIEKFIGFVTDGQNQIMAAKAKLQVLGQKPGQLNPSDLLLVQIKLSQAQQELEYSSILLAKVVDIFKQMLNVQL